MASSSGQLPRRLIRSSIGWVAVASLLGLIRLLAPAEVIEHVYSRTLFPYLRGGLEGLFGWWPFPASAAIFGFGMLAIGIDCWRQVVQASGILQKVGRASLSLVRSGSIVASTFLVLWGFNYGRVPLSEQLGINPQALSTEQLWEELRSTAKAASILRAQLPLADAQDRESLPLDQLSFARLDDAVHKQLLDLGLPSAGHIRIRKTWPGTLLRFKTSGIYFPLTGEGHVDHGLHALQVPYVAAHESFHGHGISDEGTCNFLAWLTLTRADNLYLRYSGHMMYYRYLGSAIRRRDPEGYAAFRQTLSRGFLIDLNSINDNLNRYPELIPKLRDVVYDSYLKSQGIAEGMASYSRVIDLIVAWQNAPPAPRAMPTASDRARR